MARKDRSLFNRAVAEYLKHRPNLCCVFALLDSGLAPQKIDLEFVDTAPQGVDLELEKPEEKKDDTTF